MLINLLPDFLAVLDADNPEAAYQQYRDAHRPVLDAYWRNYVLDPDSPQAEAIVASSLRAPREDLRVLAQSINLSGLAEEAIGRAEQLLQIDRPTDCYLMVGVGAANAGELVVGGRGIAFVCLEHFTGRANPETFGMGLPPDSFPLWLAHELAHTVRYTSPTSHSELPAIADLGGYYDDWQTGSRATLREFLINEGLAVHASRAVAPAFDAADYFGYPRRQYHRLRELEAFLRRVIDPSAWIMPRSASGCAISPRGITPAARLRERSVVPERSGYYLGYRMVEALVAERGLAAALRAPAAEFQGAEDVARGIQTA